MIGDSGPVRRCRQAAAPIPAIIVIVVAATLVASEIQSGERS
jgi:hypothetical protein